MVKQINSIGFSRLQTIICSVITGGMFSIFTPASAQESFIDIYADRVENRISPLMYGSCMEDVNHEIYGGLYDQKIFGESFEEDFLGMTITDFEHFGGKWIANGDQVEVKADAGAKLISRNLVFDDGSVEVELKFGEQADIAGLILRVDNPDTGADSFDGYEISLNANTNRIILGKHVQNWQLIQEVPANFVANTWNRLRVELSGATVRIYLNDSQNPAIDYTDSSVPLLAGQVGLRTWNSDVAFRNLEIQTAENLIKYQFTCESYLGTDFENFDTYGGNWIGNNKRIEVKSNSGAKIVNELNVGDGNAEVEIKFGDSRESAGLIVRVANAGVGADSFDGYEVSLNAITNRIILGKHVQNWQAIQEVPANFVANAWNRLRVELSGATIRIYLNDSQNPAINYTDPSDPLLIGKIGLRTWNSDVAFRNLKIQTEGNINEITFKSATGQAGQWDIIGETTGALFFQDAENPFNGKYAQKIDYAEGTGKAGLLNAGLNRWGIAVKSNQVFQGRLYLRSLNFDGKIHLSLQSADGSTIYAHQEITGLTDSWLKYPFTLTSDATDSNARFAIWMEEPGEVWIDQVILEGTGEERFQGLPYRADIGNAMVAEGLTFLRYGGTMINASEYRFKKMIGDPDLRPPYRGHWYPYSTNGFGIEDFLKFCEAAGFEPAFAINIEETAEDAADMVEYLNGDATTTWGAKRSENGHPKPYRVKYIEIGNEETLFEGDNAAAYNHYIERFNSLHAAITAKDPDIQLISAAWWRPDSPHISTVFRALNGKAAYWDFHPWADAADAGKQTEQDLIEMERLFKQWDPNTSMKCAIFEENGNLHNLQRALGHATTLNATRRRGDFLLTSCAANALQPYKQNDNGWDQGQIFFTPSQVWGMPPFYAQQMAASNHLPLRIQEEVSGDPDVTATRSEDGKTLVIHAVNTKNTGQNARIRLNNFVFDGEAEIFTLSGNPDDENTPEKPEKIIPQENRISVKNSAFNYVFPPFSYTVIRFTNGTTTGISPVKNTAEAANIIRQGDCFSLTYPSGITSFSIYNLAGKYLSKHSLDDTGNCPIPAGHLNKGIYILKLNGEKETALKLLK
jgi:alpha-L-arabinofuranosidase